MKKILIFAAVFLFLGSSSYGSDAVMRVSVLGESMKNGTVSTIAVSASDTTTYGGLSFSYIESSEVIQYGNRDTIYPLYFFLGLKAPWRIAPYVEVGFDLGDKLLDAIFNDNEEDDEDLVDYYYSGGITASVTSKISISLYAKKYHFIFRELISSPITRTSDTSYGAGISIRF